MEWYELPGALYDFETNESFLDKISLDIEEPCNDEIVRSHDKRQRACSWVRKRNHRKKMTRQFLSINPSLDYSKLKGMRCSPAIHLNAFKSIDCSGYVQPSYSFNPYNKVYLSPAGDLRKYYGIAERAGDTLVLDKKNRYLSKTTNRRIRHSANEDMNVRYSYFKKAYAPKSEEW